VDTKTKKRGENPTQQSVHGKDRGAGAIREEKVKDGTGGSTGGVGKGRFEIRDKGRIRENQSKKHLCSEGTSSKLNYPPTTTKEVKVSAANEGATPPGKLIAPEEGTVRKDECGGKAPQCVST